MKVRKLIKKLYQAIILRDKEQQSELYRKITLKSLKKKKTQAVQ